MLVSQNVCDLPDQMDTTKHLVDISMTALPGKCVMALLKIPETRDGFA